MSKNDVHQVIAIHGTKLSDLEGRLNQVLADLPAADIVGIDYLMEPGTYGMVAFVRYTVHR